MNEHLTPVFEVVIPAIERVDIDHWVYGGVGVAGIYGGYLRDNPDVDIFVMSEDYDRIIDLVTSLEIVLGWEHSDARPQRGRPKREWHLLGQKSDIFSIIPVYPAGESVRFVFGEDYTPQSPLTKVIGTLGDYSFVTPSSEFLKELLICKANSGRLSQDRIKKLKIDARVVMTDSEYERFCADLDRLQYSLSATFYPPCVDLPAQYNKVRQQVSPRPRR